MPVKIFFCYAREDELLLNKLKTRLKPLQRQGLINFWSDRDIHAGANWEQEINKQLREAHIILLLVSPDFMDSDYCYSNEMEQALKRHAQGKCTVIPVILRPVYWHGEPLGKRHGKDDVHAVLTGYDCGIKLENFSAFEIGDVIEAFIRK